MKAERPTNTDTCFAAKTVWFAAAVSEDAPGGVIVNMRGFCAELIGRGYRSEIVCARSGESCFLFVLRLAWKLVKAGTRRPNVIFARSFDGIACALLARILRMRTLVVLHNHGWEERSYETERTLTGNRLPPKTTMRARLVRFPLVRGALRLSHGCWCGTVGEIRWARHRRYPKRKRCFYVPNGVSAPPACFWAGKSFPAPHFLTVGPHTWKKNLDYSKTLIASLRATVPDVKLTMAGCGGGAARDPSLRSKSSNGWLTLLTSVPPADMETWYRTCPFLIAASRYEGGHPLSILEAMAQGCIVFATGIAAHREIIRDGCNGILLSGDPRDDRSRILSVLAHADTASLRIKSWETARRHRWTRQGERLVRVLGRL